MLNTIVSPKNLAYFTAIDAMGQPSECTFCPSNTEQCAHLDGHWVRIIAEEAPDRLHMLEYGVFWSWPPDCSITGFYASDISIAEVWFEEREAEMRKIAREGPGDVNT